MSYLENRLRALPLALLVLAIFAALPGPFTHQWADATYIALMCLACALFYWPEAYFRRGIAGGRRKRNLVVNWAVLLVSTGLAAACAQYESATLGLFHANRGYARLEAMLALLVFVVTYCALWLGYAKVMQYRRLARRNRRTPNPALR